MEKTKNQGKGSGPPGVAMMVGWGGRPEAGGGNDVGVGWSACNWKRKKRKSAEMRGRRKSRLLLLKEGVWAAAYGGNDGFHTADGGGGCSRRSWRKKWWWCWLSVAEEERKRSRRIKSAAGKGRKAGFFAYFGPEFLLLQAIKPASIYRRWKRVISSTPG